MEKITKRNMYEALVNFANVGSLTFTTEEGEHIVSNEELLAFAENEIGLLDKKTEKAKERAATKKAGADELAEAVYAAMSDEEFEPIAEIAARIEGEDVTVAKITYRLTQLVKAGKAENTALTIPGGEGVKTRKVKGFRKLA